MARVKLTEEQIKYIAGVIYDAANKIDSEDINEDGYFSAKYEDCGNEIDGLYFDFEISGSYDGHMDGYSGEFWGTPCSEEWWVWDNLQYMDLDRLFLYDEDGDEVKISESDYNAIREQCEVRYTPKRYR